MITKIAKEDYLFAVDRDKTSRYYASYSRCECEGCKNFYRQIRGRFPKLEEFLREFGINISKPEEMLWLDDDAHVEYTPYYTVAGNIEKIGSRRICYDGLDLKFYPSENQEISIPTERTEPYFVIAVFGIVLPWLA